MLNQSIPRFDHPDHPAQREAVRLLEAPMRRRIYDLAVATPGLTVGELLLALDVGWGTLHHHVSKLEQSGLLHTVQQGRRRLVFPGGAPVDGGKARAVLGGAASRRVAKAVARDPGLPMADLLKRVEDSPRAVYYHVKRLIEAGLLVSESPTRYTRLFPAPALAETLSHMRDSV